MTTGQKSELMGANQASKDLFDGTRSPWSLLQAARKHQIPHIRLGSRVFFNPETIREWVQVKAATSVKTAEPESTDGIRRLK